MYMGWLVSILVGRDAVPEYPFAVDFGFLLCYHDREKVCMRKRQRFRGEQIHLDLSAAKRLKEPVMKGCAL